jgi:DtxR family Mn-dependent transcriptional regulator
MTNLSANQRGRIVRINTYDHKKLKKIMAMGALPGMAVILIQKVPSYVFQIGQSQFAVDKELAECICVTVK